MTLLLDTRLMHKGARKFLPIWSWGHDHLEGEENTANLVLALLVPHLYNSKVKTRKPIPWRVHVALQGQATPTAL